MDKSKYNRKASDSFKTKLNLYIFDRVVNDLVKTIDKSDFNQFKITKENVDIYTKIYWQQPIESKINKKEISIIEKEIKEWKEDKKELIEQFRQNYIKNKFPEVFPYDDFLDLIKTNKSCKYCGITVKEIERLADNKQLNKSLSEVGV